MPAIKTRLDEAVRFRRRARANPNATRTRYPLRRFLKKAHDALAAGNDPKAVNVAARIYVHQDLRNRVNAIVARRLSNETTEHPRPRLSRLHER